MKWLRSSRVTCTRDISNRLLLLVLRVLSNASLISLDTRSLINMARFYVLKYLSLLLPVSLSARFYETV